MANKVSFKYITGMMNARNVIDNAPEKSRNKPNLGMKIENIPVNKTTIDRQRMLFNLGIFSNEGNFSNILVFSEISKAGIA